MTNANIAARLAEVANAYPERWAIHEPERSIRFGELAERVARVAGALSARGIGPGDGVLLFVPMSIELYTALLAVHQLGGVAVFVDPWAGRKRLDAGVAAASPKAFLGTPRSHLLRLTSRAIRSIPVKLMVDDKGKKLDALAKKAEPLDPIPRDADAPALLTFTTGSTGRPKGVTRTHGFLWTQHQVLSKHLDTEAGDVDMPTLPVFVLHNLALGATTVLPDFDARRPGDLDATKVHRQVVEYGVETTTGSPAFYDRLLHCCEEEGRTLPFRHLYTGGAPVWPHLVRRLAERVEGTAHILYGSTEAEPISSITAEELLEAERSGGNGICVGRPVDEIALKLIRPIDGPVELGPQGLAPLECGPGEVGEVIVSGEHVVREYRGDPDSTRLNKIPTPEGVWHRTGDGARLDERGRIWLMGRVSQRVRRDGGDHWSTAVELCAMRLPGVTHAAYFGEGERAILCLECNTPLAPEDVHAGLGNAPVDELHQLREIPRDPRHQSKTDLDALRKKLRKR